MTRSVINVILLLNSTKTIIVHAKQQNLSTQQHNVNPVAQNTTTVLNVTLTTVKNVQMDLF